jgi:hypothetical protein
MRRSMLFCKHYRAMSEHKTCAAGVDYESLKGMTWEQRPCFAHAGDVEPKPGCSLAVLPSSEEQEEEEREIRERFEHIGKARAAIVAACGAPWKKGMSGNRGRIDCPVCGKPGALGFTRAGYNGHVHARCDTVNCVSWME